MKSWKREEKLNIIIPVHKSIILFNLLVDMKKTLGDFKLEVKAGSFSDSQIVVLLGQNGTGKVNFH